MNKFPFEKFPRIETDRLILREVRDDDVADFFLLRSNPSIMQFIPRPVAQTEQDVLDLIHAGREGYEKSEIMNFAIALKETDQFIGAAGYFRPNWNWHRTEVGYILNPEHRGKGYVHEAMNALVDFAFDVIGFHSLEAIIDPRNQASINVVEKLGFVKEGHIKEREFWNGEYLDSLIYSLIR